MQNDHKQHQKLGICFSRGFNSPREWAGNSLMHRTTGNIRKDFLFSDMKLELKEVGIVCQWQIECSARQPSSTTQFYTIFVKQSCILKLLFRIFRSEEIFLDYIMKVHPIFVLKVLLIWNFFDVCQCKVVTFEEFEPPPGPWGRQPIYVGNNGAYRNILLAIHEDVEETTDLLENIKVCINYNTLSL